MRARLQSRAPCDRRQDRSEVFVAIRKQLSAFFCNNFCDVPARRCLLAFFVDERLAFRGNGLIGRHRVDREKPGRMAGEAIHGDHSDPIFDEITDVRRVPLDQVIPKGAKLLERFGVVKNEQVLGGLCLRY